MKAICWDESSNTEMEVQFEWMLGRKIFSRTFCSSFECYEVVFFLCSNFGWTVWNRGEGWILWQTLCFPLFVTWHWEGEQTDMGTPKRKTRKIFGWWKHGFTQCQTVSHSVLTVPHCAHTMPTPLFTFPLKTPGALVPLAHALEVPLLTADLPQRLQPGMPPALKSTSSYSPLLHPHILSVMRC